MKAATILAIMSVLAIAACAREPVIRTDFDRTADFSQFRSFGFDAGQETDAGGYRSLLTERLQRAVRQQLVSRGYVEQADSPDLLVNFYAREQDKVRVTSTPRIWGPMPYGIYGQRDGLYGSWAGYSGWTDVESYTQGTLNVDLIDRERRQLVWQGIVASEVDDMAETAPTDEEIDQQIAKMFVHFPDRTRPVILPKAQS